MYRNHQLKKHFEQNTNLWISFYSTGANRMRKKEWMERNNREITERITDRDGGREKGKERKEVKIIWQRAVLPNTVG